LPKKPAAHHRFDVYRLQFVIEGTQGSAGPPLPHSEITPLLIENLSRGERRVGGRFKNWAVGNLDKQTFEGSNYLYGRIGKIHRSVTETFEEGTFENVALETSESVAFVFQERSEIICVEHRTNLTAADAIKRIAYIFNNSASNPRNYKMAFYPIESKGESLSKLQGLSKVTRFRAKLRAPNPYTGPLYRAWWEAISSKSKASEVDIVYKNDETGLNVNDDSAIGRAVDMSADAYGSWKADGTDGRGRKRQVESTTQPYRFYAPYRNATETIAAVARAIENLPKSEP